MTVLITRRTELIDTLWNVNAFLFFLIDSLIFELIDTLWNVNYNRLHIVT